MAIINSALRRKGLGTKLSVKEDSGTSNIKILYSCNGAAPDTLM